MSSTPTAPMIPAMTDNAAYRELLIAGWAGLSGTQWLLEHCGERIADYFPEAYRKEMGYYQIVSSELTMDAREIIEKYHGLTQIEEQFHAMKGELETRPLYVRTPEHIDAHLLPKEAVHLYPWDNPNTHPYQRSQVPHGRPDGFPFEFWHRSSVGKYHTHPSIHIHTWKNRLLSAQYFSIIML